MALTPNADKTAFYNRIRSDPWIARNLGIKTEDDAVEIILKRRATEEELSSTSTYILIFDPPANPVPGPFQHSVMQIDVLMPTNLQNKADTLLEQIVSLCGPDNEDRWCMKGKYIEKVLTVGNLTSVQGVYRAGVRFFYYSSTITPKRTI